MQKVTSDKIRNIVLLSHGGAGKSSLAESMLFESGGVTRLGSIDDGTSTSDYEDEEIKRQVSIQTAILPCAWNGHKINVIDTPGYADFRGETVSGVRVADAAVIVISAPSGVEVGTRQFWKLVEEIDIPKIVFVNKMDRENSNEERVIDSISQQLGRQCVPVQITIGSESTFSAVKDLLVGSNDDNEDIQGRLIAARDRLTEAVAESDDDLATKYLEGEDISEQEMASALKQGISSGMIVPVMFGSAISGIGTTSLLDTIIEFMPSPLDVKSSQSNLESSGEPVLLPCSADGPLAALVFKTSADPFVGKLSYLRVYSGTFSGDTVVWDSNKEESERIGQIFVIKGKTQEPVDGLVAGDIGAVAKMNSVVTGDTLALKDKPHVLGGIEFPNHVYQMAVYPTSKTDVDKLTSALARIEEEDPSLSVIRDPDTLEILLGGLGDTHVGVAVEKMKRKFGVEIELKQPKVAYKETISSKSRVEYRHKKQSGGSGQFGHVWLEMEPLARGSGFEFENKIVGGAVPREYIPAVEKGCLKSISDGVLAGYPVVDVRATLVDGSFHSVDSSGIAFEIAGARAFDKGIKEASPVLLEPIFKVGITVPDGDTGEIMGDMNSKRGRILGMSPGNDGTTLIEVEVPQVEMLSYAIVLRSQTQGRGSFTMDFDHYEAVPGHLSQKIIDEHSEPEEE